MRPSHRTRIAACVAALASVSWATAAHADEIVGVTVDNELVTFDSSAPGTVTDTVAITGLAVGENIVGLDFRPADGRLYGLGSTSVLYSIDSDTGAATAVGVAFTPALAGTDFGFDFNPAVDRVRVVSDSNSNFRLNPDSGALAATDTSLAFDVLDTNTLADPNVVGVAYDRDTKGTTVTTLFGIDSGVDALVRIGSADGTPTSPNSGVLTTIGALGVDTTGTVGFDIVSKSSDTAYAALQTPAATTSGLYTVNLSTGAATLVGTIGGDKVIRDIAVVNDRLKVRKLIIKFNFKKSDKDQIQLDAVLSDVLLPAEEQAIDVNVGGATQTFTLTKNGHAKTGDDTLFAKANKKVVGEVRLTMHLKKEDFSDELADEGMDGTADARHETRHVVVTINYGGVTLVRNVTLDYKAKIGKTGMAKVTPGGND